MAPFSSQDEDLSELTWHSATRYYVARIQTNLFGELELFRTWGGLGTRRCGHKTEPLQSTSEGLNRLRKEHLRRARRGYALQLV